MKLFKRTWAEISLDNLAENYHSYYDKVAKDTNTDIMCVVKASCYGHSDTAAAPFLQNELGAKWFAVSNLDEAIRLRDMGITGEILILGYTAPEEAAELEKYDIIQAVLDIPYARALSANAAKAGLKGRALPYRYRHWHDAHRYSRHGGADCAGYLRDRGDG